MGKGHSIWSDLISDVITEVPTILGIAGLQSTLSGAKAPRNQPQAGKVEKEKEVPTNPFSKEDEAVFSQLERLLSEEDFDTLSRLFTILEPHQADDFRYYVVKQNQLYERVVKSRKVIRAGAGPKGPEKDEVFEEFDFSLTANLYGQADVRVKYLSFVAGKIRQFDREGKDGPEETKRLLIKRRYLREKSVRQEALEAAGKATEKAGEIWKAGEDLLYRLVVTKKLGNEYRPLLERFLTDHAGLTEDDAWQRGDFVIDILVKRVKEKQGLAEPERHPTSETGNFRECVASRLRRLADRIGKK